MLARSHCTDKRLQSNVGQSNNQQVSMHEMLNNLELAMGWNGNKYDCFQKEYQYHSGLTLLEKLTELNHLNGKSVIDLGCGNGELSSLISQHTNMTVKCVDADASMIDVFTRKHSSDFTEIEHADIALWLDKQRESSSDVIFSNAVFHWLGTHEQLTPVLLNCYRVLKHNDMIALRFSLSDNALNIKRYLHNKIVEFNGAHVDDFFYSQLTLTRFLTQLELIGFTVLYSKEESYYPFNNSDRDLDFILDSQPIYDYIPKDRYADFIEYVTDAWNTEVSKVRLKSHHALIIASKNA
ncbi:MULTISPECIES: class I SAM-dependent methyltransferase [Vibrio]|uniref:class I SAM-dependent methyltransferase n=1 Tax=Vibrio TaxID=662 RepID=UPI00215B9E9F|nr:MULTISPECIES: class I SAM-dependent methyltransferase [Vibrio]ELB2282858.1 class I SAM-dependent methyltransferase [Vibrio alginolyticus]MCR9381255.1 class I SAM-dependent methyltransferase [Vibrio alginolyticus]MCR9431729.1 class I SAM-dependent methyltransferase [Vibrio alginolyticus]MCR9436435.1 class I SAM-dependent methyltransferase [Vibrio alginolyticus]MCS0197273.1 class I SAM-dependent methyltransferase [Vibrio alginolyticus]